MHDPHLWRNNLHREKISPSKTNAQEHHRLLLLLQFFRERMIVTEILLCNGRAEQW
jgi:hypothetical protein